jgi:hypothetical protein
MGNCGFGIGRHVRSTVTGIVRRCASNPGIGENIETVRLIEGGTRLDPYCCRMQMIPTPDRTIFASMSDLGNPSRFSRT